MSITLQDPTGVQKIVITDKTQSNNPVMVAYFAKDCEFKAPTDGRCNILVKILAIHPLYFNLPRWLFPRVSIFTICK